MASINALTKMHYGMLMVIFLYLERLREIDLCIQGIADLANIL